MMDNVALITNIEFIKLETKFNEALKQVSALKDELGKVQTRLDEHLLEHMIEERNKEFDLRYPIEDE